MTNIVSLNSAKLKELKDRYIELVHKGYVEYIALETLGFHRGDYYQALTEDADFALRVEEARKNRADFWVAKIAQDIDKNYDKDEIPSQRLKFDKLQFLAKADNPDKYGSNSKSKIDISLDLTQFKLLPPEEAVKALANDPFAIEAEFKEIDDEELL